MERFWYRQTQIHLEKWLLKETELVIRLNGLGYIWNNSFQYGMNYTSTVHFCQLVTLVCKTRVKFSRNQYELQELYSLLVSSAYSYKTR